MAFSNLRKETSERSDVVNWAKQSLIQNTPFHFDGIEGCNENAENVATHLFERARVDYDGHDDMDEGTVLQLIQQLETLPVLERKINFAKAFQLNLSYVLYCDGIDNVWVYEFQGIHSIRRIAHFESYPAFSAWIATIKGWKSKKVFREKQDLPYFDKALRRAGTAWPTNIDCFISDENNMPVAILEFQNAHTISVKEHCNNEYFLCKQAYTNANGFIDCITFPDLPFSRNWNKHSAYKKAMHDYATTRKREDGLVISRNYTSYSLKYDYPNMKIISHNPPLLAKSQTFPFIYYKYKRLVVGRSDLLPMFFVKLLSNNT